MSELTEASMADYKVTFRDTSRSARTVRAAYVTADQVMTYMLAFKDHEHRTVTLIAQDEVLSVDRLEPEHVAEKKTIAERGFRTTSQVMEDM